jgi:phage terminase large subunit
LLIDYTHPDYDPIYRERIERLQRLRSNPQLLGPLKTYYRDHPVEFICDWAATADPRNAEVGLPVIMPFLLFDRQKQFVEWVYARWRGREDGLAEKSRDMGVSWCCVAIAVHIWLFHPNTVVGFGSRVEDLVDKLGDPKTLFSKIRQLVSLLPREFQPVGYNEAAHGLYMRLLNPENGSAIIGEAGTNLGRGARASIYFVDEAAFIAQPELVDAALSQTSNCKIWVSTPNGNGNTFYRKRHAGKIPVFTFHWTQDPRKDQEWYDKQRATLDPTVLAQEVDLDYNASVSDAWISGDKITRAQMVGPADVFSYGQWIVGIDAAHFGDDESVVHSRKGRLNLAQKTFRGVDGPTLASLVLDHCDILERTEDVYAIVIELGGPGAGCHDFLKRSQRFGKKVRGIHPGARQANSKDYNLRAKFWRAAKDYIEEGVPDDGPSTICLPNDPELKSQIASVRYGYKDGMLLMQDKKEYKKHFGKSPDRADAFALTFAVDVAIPKVKPKQVKEVFVGNWM